MNGKELCKLLKSIRIKMASMYDIPYNPKECTHEGECPGTCPQCDAELKYLTEEIKKLDEQGFTINFDILTSEEKEALAMTVGIEEHPTPHGFCAGIPADHEFWDNGSDNCETGDVIPIDWIEESADDSALQQLLGDIPDDELKNKALKILMKH